MSFHNRAGSRYALICLALSLLCASTRLRAQFNSGIQGTVTDPSGAAVAGATVTITNKLTKVSRVTKTTKTGVYAVSGLTPGTYTVRVEKTGFKAGVLESVVIASEGTQAANVQLQLGSTQQNVTVTAPVTALINTQSATLSGTLPNKRSNCCLRLAGILSSLRG